MPHEMYEEEAPAYDDLTTYWFALFDRSFLQNANCRHLKFIIQGHSGTQVYLSQDCTN